MPLQETDRQMGQTRRPVCYLTSGLQCQNQSQLLDLQTSGPAWLNVIDTFKADVLTATALTSVLRDALL